MGDNEYIGKRLISQASPFTMLKTLNAYKGASGNCRVVGETSTARVSGLHDLFYTQRSSLAPWTL